MIRYLTLGLALTLALVACTDGSVTLPTTSSTLPELQARDFESVCRGIPQQRATAFDPAQEGPHPVLLFSGQGPEFSEDLTPLPRGWVPRFPDLAAAQLVACVDRITSTLVETCSGYEVEFEGEYVVEIYDAEFAFTLYEAATATVVETATVTAAVERCPSFVVFTEGQSVKKQYADLGDQLEAFLAPHVG